MAKQDTFNLEEFAEQPSWTAGELFGELLDEYAAESFERMTEGGVRTSVLCAYGYRDRPEHYIVYVAGEWLTVGPISRPAIVSTDIRLVALTDYRPEPLYGSGVHQ